MTLAPSRIALFISLLNGPGDASIHSLIQCVESAAVLSGIAHLGPVEGIRGSMLDVFRKMEHALAQGLQGLAPQGPRQRAYLLHPLLEPRQGCHRPREKHVKHVPLVRQDVAHRPARTWRCGAGISLRGSS